MYGAAACKVVGLMYCCKALATLPSLFLLPDAAFEVHAILAVQKQGRQVIDDYPSGSFRWSTRDGREGTTYKITAP